MAYSRQESVREQMRFLRRQFLQDGGLPFTDILSEELVSQALKAIDGFLDRIYSPLVTLWVFLGQVLSAEPGRLPTAGCAETRNRISNGPHRSRLLARLWRGA